MIVLFQLVQWDRLLFVKELNLLIVVHLLVVSYDITGSELYSCPQQFQVQICVHVHVW